MRNQWSERWANAEIWRILGFSTKYERFCEKSVNFSLFFSVSLAKLISHRFLFDLSWYITRNQWLLSYGSTILFPVRRACYRWPKLGGPDRKIIKFDLFAPSLDPVTRPSETPIGDISFCFENWLTMFLPTIQRISSVLFVQAVSFFHL